MDKVTTTTEMKKISVIGIVSFAAVVHSHLCWVYSIIYIAYHKISPQPQLSSSPRRPSRSITLDSKKKKRHHSRKKSLTSKPKTIIPSVKKEHVPILHAYNTFPSTKTSSSNIHKLIQSQRRKKTSLDDDDLLYTSCSCSNEDLLLQPTKKRDRAISLLRSTFNLKQSSSSSSEDETTTTTILIAAKPKVHTTILRKLSVKERPKLSLRTFSWKKEKANCK